MGKHIKAQLDKIIGHNIATTRINRELSRDELAEVMELTSSHLGLVERGERGATAVTLEALSKIMDVPIDHFFAKNQVSEQFKIDDNKTASKTKKILSLLSNLSVTELDFVIYIIKGMPKEKTDNTEE